MSELFVFLFRISRNGRSRDKSNSKLHQVLFNFHCDSKSRDGDVRVLVKGKCETSLRGLSSQTQIFSHDLYSGPILAKDYV